MCAVVEGQSAPPICGILRESRIALEGRHESIESIVMAHTAIGDVPRGRMVVEFIWVSIGESDRCVTLVCVYVAREDKVDRIVEEQRFEHLSAVFTDVAAIVLGANIPRAMARCAPISVQLLQLNT